MELRARTRVHGSTADIKVTDDSFIRVEFPKDRLDFGDDRMTRPGGRPDIGISLGWRFW